LRFRKQNQNENTLNQQRQSPSENAIRQQPLIARQLIYDLLENDWQELISRVFSYYCSYGEPMNNSQMKGGKFVKFLKDAGLIKQGVLQNH